MHVQGSPFTRTFLPGPPDANKTLFLKHSSIVVCTAGLTHTLTIEPRDEFNNVCQFRNNDDPVQGYAIAVRDVSALKEVTWTELKIPLE